MNSISEGQQLDVRNLISFRGKLKQEELPEVMLRMKSYADVQGANVMGGPISVTYGVEQTKDGVVADAEIMMPLDKEVSGTEEFAWREQLFLANAIKLKYAGTPAMFQSACNEMNAYMKEKKHVPITAGYIVTKGVDQISGTVDMEVYVGVNPNVV